MNDDQLPEPLTTVKHNISGFDGFMLDTDRLLASELWALSTGDEFKAAVSLWCRAWKQSPAGSLPDDERTLAAFSGAGPKWRKVRDVALRGFVKCSDGRLYHRFLCADVLRAAAKKSERNERTKAATEARRKQRDEQRDVNRDDEHKPNVTTSHGQDRTGQDRTGQDVIIDKKPHYSAGELLADLEIKLREAAGWQHESSPNLFVTGPIQALIESGADIDLDVLPIVRARAPSAKSRTTWKYFVDAIAQARDDRIRAATIVSPESHRGKTNGGNANHSGRKARSFVGEALAALGGEGHQGPEPSRD